MSGVGGQAEPGVDHDRQIGLFDDDAQHRLGFDAAVAADRGAERHHRRDARLFQPLRKHRIGVDVGQHGKAHRDQFDRRLVGFDGIRQQVVRIGVDFELDPVVSGGAGDLADADRVLGGARAGGVQHHLDAGGNGGENILVLPLFADFDPAERDGDKFGAGSLNRGGKLRVGGEFAGAEEQPGGEFPAGDDQRFHSDNRSFPQEMNSAPNRPEQNR